MASEAFRLDKFRRRQQEWLRIGFECPVKVRRRPARMSFFVPCPRAGKSSYSLGDFPKQEPACCNCDRVSSKRLPPQTHDYQSHQRPKREVAILSTNADIWHSSTHGHSSVRVACHCLFSTKITSQSHH